MAFGIYRSVEIGVDLGTANTLIVANNEIIYDEPSMIAIETEANQLVAIGKEAMTIHEKTNPNFRTIKPLIGGVIADFSGAELMFRTLVKKVRKKSKVFLEKKFSMLVAVPSSITEVEKRAVKDSCLQAGADEVCLIFQPIAAAIGAGMDIKSPNGIMIVDLGAGTTEIALISLSGMVCELSIRTAGNVFTDDIINFLRRYHSLLIGEKTAEKIKIHIGSALEELGEEIENYQVVGRDLLTGIPKTISLNYSEVAMALEKSLAKVEESILKVLEQSPPELASDLFDNGIYLCGGGALFRGLPERLEAKTKLKIKVVENPSQTVVRGIAKVLEQKEKYQGIIFS